MNKKKPDEFTSIDELIRHIIAHTLGNTSIQPGMIGVNVIIAGGGNPPFSGKPGSSSPDDVTNPHIELCETESDLLVTVELPGLERDHIKAIVRDTTLFIIGFDGVRRFQGSIDIPLVHPDTCIQNIQNGVLELHYKLAEKPDPDQPEKDAETSDSSEVPV
ncbi:MAG: Hsp20/alpha crystallin family protein [Methanospirillaceae archaeon]|nr:Hsp20/alpha crystallin family protein [Methanospirillaceae archaeon]